MGHVDQNVLEIPIDWPKIGQFWPLEDDHRESYLQEIKVSDTAYADST